MKKNYDPAAIEKKWYDFWEKGQHFTAGNDPDAENFCIMIPPPNVTGSLHMGHAFQDTIMDALVRYQRMKGKNVLWQPGTDHAGIATQMVVERQLAAQGKQRTGMGRAAFVDAVWDWKAQSGGQITQQLRRMGSSLDWQRERFTLDEDLSESVRTVFVRLYEEGLIYRGKRLVNWDPVLQTAVSDLEVVNEEATGFMHYVRYPFVDDEGNGVDIGTTRPETILADGAIAVHPEDERYSHLVGRRVWVPMTERQIPIITDEYVDPSFGSGCVKITGAHDFNDFAVTQRHADKNLPLINLFTPDAHMNENAPPAYQGLERFAAREKIVADLEAAGLLLRMEAHNYVLPKGDRSGSVIEPYLTDQWFVDAQALAKRAIEVVEEGEVRFVPKNWENTYFDWMRNIQDWCISRQLWWGHRIPAWYGDNGEIFVAEDENSAKKQAAQAGYKGGLRQDEDVLDTWFSSALWPFSTLGWPKETEELERFYPTSILVTGFDIIFFWVARMIMFGLKFTGQVPFKEVYVHGLVRDKNGDKMSKSKGNVLDPIDLIDGIGLENLVTKRTGGLMQPQHAKRIEKDTRKDYPDGIPAFGCDALRFTFAAMASTGRDIRFDLSRCTGYRNFCNKLWNGARFVLMNTEDQALDSTPSDHVVDQWIDVRLVQTVEQVEQAFATYRLDLAANAIYDFVWHDFCDWYLELSKVLLQQDRQAAKTRYQMLCILEKVCCLAHPIIPFITESIWQHVKLLLSLPEESIMRRPYPAVAVVEDYPQMDWIQSVIGGVRGIRAQMNIAPSKKITVYISQASVIEQQWLSSYKQLLLVGAKLERIELCETFTDKAVSMLCGAGKLVIPIAGLIDVESEQKRLQKELAQIEKQLDQLTHKLNNPAFTKKAPEAVVEQVRSKHVVCLEQKDHLRKQLLDLMA